MSEKKEVRLLSIKFKENDEVKQMLKNLAHQQDLDVTIRAVSYTHLDVYKRQELRSFNDSGSPKRFSRH